MKNLRFGFVLTEREKRFLETIAEVEGGLSEAATLRRLIRRAARELALPAQAAPAAAPKDESGAASG